MRGVERRREQTPFVPLEHFLVAVIVPDLGGALAVENANHFFVQMALRIERAAGRNLTDIATGDSLHAMQLNECCLAAHARVRRDFQRAQIRHAVADVNRQALAFHPADVTGFLVDRRDIHGDLRYELYYLLLQPLYQNSGLLLKIRLGIFA